MASPISYYGSKSRLASSIIAQFPDHHCFVEVCAGSAAVLMKKPPSKVEVLNDIDGDLVNFYRVLRHHSDDLIRLLQLTPYARDEHHDCRTTFKDAKLDRIERARRYFVATCQSYSGLVGDSFSRSKSKRLAVTFKNRVDKLDRAADRLRSIVVENRPALKLIQKYDSPETLFYVDPPYLHETRTAMEGRDGKYRHEMSNDDHCALLVSLNKIEGNALLSGYDSPLYRMLLKNWRVCWRKDVQQASAAHLKDKDSKIRTEVLWANF